MVIYVFFIAVEKKSFLKPAEPAPAANERTQNKGTQEDSRRRQWDLKVPTLATPKKEN